MKKVLVLLVTVLLTFSVSAQLPQMMSYQAIIRDAGNTLAVNHFVGMRISILQGSASGTPVYIETHATTTNPNGLVSVEIGKGTPALGTFAGIDWSKGLYFIKTETDPLGGTNYSITGTSQILSVPYALYAKSAANGFSGNYDDLINRPTILNSSLWTTATGYMSLNANSGESNTAYGYQSLYSNSSGYNNTATGIQSLWNNTTGFNNTANGAWTLMNNTTGNSNTAIGYNALSANITGYSNTGAGTWSLYSNTSGYHNTGFGQSTLYSNQDGADNTAVGLDALFNNTQGSQNTAIGSGALFSNTTANGNTASGFRALYSNTIGYDNTAHGDQALLSNTDGILNTANGYLALKYNTTGDNNTAFGGFALSASTTADYNTAVGALALTSTTTGYNNSSLGNQTLFINTTGFNNTAVGNQSLQFNSTGWNNTAVGHQSGNSNNAGNFNVFLGSQAGYYETGSNKLFIDNQSRAGVTDARSKALIYGQFDADPANQLLTINGNVGIGTLTPANRLTVNGSIGLLMGNFSDLRGLVFLTSTGEQLARIYPGPDNSLAFSTQTDNTPNMVINNTGEVILNNRRITNVAKPVNSRDVATKAYVDSLINEKITFVRDNDANIYAVVKIADQFWMGSSLRTTKYNDGSPITLVKDGSDWNGLTTPAYCWYNNDEGATSAYGALYNWYAVNTGILCPTGWHVPSQYEWNTLADYLGGYEVAGGKLKTLYGWIEPIYRNPQNDGATNETSFSGQPGGYRAGDFNGLGCVGLYWTSTATSSANSWIRQLIYLDAYLNYYSEYKTIGASVRCLRDN